ncbi:MAG: TetR/AcrR family transcriptional regulator [Cellulosilyticaceae bacterium]
MRRQAQNEASKEKILKAALQEFGQKGYDSASTNNICKNNDISKGLLFHYYKSKDELFLICVEDCFVKLTQYLEAHIDKEITNIEEALNRYFETRFNFFKTFSEYEKIFYTAVINAPEHLKEAIEVRRSQLNEVNRAFLLNLMSRLNLKPEVNVEYVMDLIYGLTNYLHMKYKSNHLEQQEESHAGVLRHSKEIQEIIMMLFYGIVE